MAGHRPKVPPQIKLLLIEEAGRKCSNPGCANRLVELHHIEEWHVYQTHDERSMIALCAACHDSVDRGALQLSDDTLYEWKGIPREAASTAHLFVEPGLPPRLLLGSLAFRGDSGLVVFDFADHHRLSFVVRDNEIMLLNAKLSDPDGSPLLDVVDGYVRQRTTQIELETRPGRVRIPGSARVGLIPDWARSSLLHEDPSCPVDTLSVLDLEVLRPGLVRVEGIWMDADKGVVITQNRLSFLHRSRSGPLTMIGDGESSVINYRGPVGMAVFNL